MRIQNSVDTSDQVVGQVLDIRQITTAQLAQLGVSRLAYIKPVSVAGEAVFAIHGADGTPMAVAPNQELAWEAILEHEMVPTLVH
ncbi:DUF1150 family protein [Acidisoma cellulosilytica]|uniref:DUF1150 family protein n=1 Tax=Acidisoma cellulosilyticum TaxID=2802395 RepID=A0A964E3C9_9PROT|nr:DUF1150 family protein [Acidisoma cellulosilyticum]MCB8880321.1 DUF1150 family protein [Acidisoma cellulosilyticum]